MTLRQEFEKVYLTKPYGKLGDMNPFESALWAAKWAMERCASYIDIQCKDKNFCEHVGHEGNELGKEIRQLSKELDQ